jgi:hypothetical protein
MFKSNKRHKEIDQAASQQADEQAQEEQQQADIQQQLEEADEGQDPDFDEFHDSQEPGTELEKSIHGMYNVHDSHVYPVNWYTHTTRNFV